MSDAKAQMGEWLNLLDGVALAALVISAVGVLWPAIRWWRGPGHKRSLWFALAGLVIFAITLVSHQWLLFNVWLPMDAPELANMPGTLAHVGDFAPEFVVLTTEGTHFDLRESRGRVVLVNFFATWCGPCNAELPHLQQIWEEFGAERDFQMIAVSRQEPIDTVKEFKKDHDFGICMAVDPERSAYSKYAEDLIPRTFLIDRDGRIVYQCAGFGEAIPEYQAEMSKLKKLIKSRLNKDG